MKLIPALQIQTHWVERMLLLHSCIHFLFCPVTTEERPSKEAQQRLQLRLQRWETACIFGAPCSPLSSAFCPSCPTAFWVTLRRRSTPEGHRSSGGRNGAGCGTSSLSWRSIPDWNRSISERSVLITRTCTFWPVALRAGGFSA